MQLPIWGDHAYDVLFKTVANLESFVSTNYQAPILGDHFYDLLMKLNHNLANFSGGSSGPIPTIPTPSGINDFSGLPGGVAPPAGEDKVYWAVRDAATYWTIGSGDTQWTVVDKNNP